MKDRIPKESGDGAFGAYIAARKPLPAPAVVVLHEVFGVNPDIRKTCDELAEHGLIAVAPDLFWRQEPGVDLSVPSEPDWQHGLRLYQAYDRAAGAKAVKAPANSVAKLPGCSGKVAVMGFCLGGLMTFLPAEAKAHDGNLTAAARELGHRIGGVLNVLGTAVSVIRLIEAKTVLPVGLGGDAEVDARLLTPE